ncbi:GNAT family N-acetyltransferase [Roseateles sp.]|uniref:GNAT family N-acetyltransferase n=1 Tax=Roseateles sp. TaxID=1971397 RepID=UPI0039EB58F6
MSGTTHCQWTLHPLQRGLGEHAAAWDTLRRRLFAANAMLDSQFVDGLLANFGEGNEVLAMLHQDGQTEGMCLLQRKSPLVWCSFQPSQAQIGLTLLKDAASLPALIRALPGWAMELDLLCNDPDFGDLATSTFADTHTIDHCLTMHVELVGSFQDYWRARPKKLAQNLDRYRRRAEAEGVQQHLRIVTDAADMEAVVARYALLEVEGWKGRRGTAVGSSPDQLRFYQQLMGRLAEQGLAIAWELWFNDQLVASRLAIREGSTITMLKTTYLESAAAYSPGRELLRRAVEHCFELAPGGRIEFYTDATEDQLRWASGHRWIRHVAFYRTPVARMAATGARLGRRRLKGDDDSAGSQDFKVQVYRHPREFPPQVQEFFAESEVIDTQFGADWYRNLIDTVFPEHPGVRFYVLLREGRPLAALPLIADRGRLGWELRSLSNYYTALYAPPLSANPKCRHVARLIKAVHRDHPGLVSMKLYPLSTDATSFRTLQCALNRANLACFAYFGFGNWHMRVRQDWASYLQGLDGRQRSTITRMGKKFAAEGGRLEIISGKDDVERGIQAYQQVYAASWKQPEPYQAFIPGLIQLCAERGWLRLGVAWHGDKPVAAQLWIIANGKADIYKLAYDEAYKAYSPGTLLTAMLMQQAMDVDRAGEIDYLIGDDPYKKTWMSSRRERWGLVAYNPFSLGGAIGLARELLGRTIHLLMPATAPATPVKK